MDTDYELNNEEDHEDHQLPISHAAEVTDCSEKMPNGHPSQSESDNEIVQDFNKIVVSNETVDKTTEEMETPEFQTSIENREHDENLQLNSELELFDIEITEDDVVSTEEIEEVPNETESTNFHPNTEDLSQTNESSSNDLSPSEPHFDPASENVKEDLQNLDFSSMNGEANSPENASENVDDGHNKEEIDLQPSTPVSSVVPDEFISSLINSNSADDGNIMQSVDTDGSLRGKDTTETLQNYTHEANPLSDDNDAELNGVDDNEVNVSLPMDSAYVEGSTVAQLPASDTLMSISKQSFGSDDDVLHDNEDNQQEDNLQNGFSSSTLELQKKYATWDGRNETRSSVGKIELNGELNDEEIENPRIRRRSHDNIAETPRTSAMPLALSQSFHMDFNTQLREMDEALKRAESVQKKVVDDDDKFPDSVTPIKVEHSLRDSGYDIPFIDDEAFYYQDWYVTEDHRWSRLEPSPHWMHSKSRFKGIAEPEILTATSSPMRSVPTPTKATSAQTPIRESISDRQCPPPKAKKGIFSFFGCVSRTAT